MNVRSLLGSLQLPVAGVGLFLLATAIQQLATLETPAQPDVPGGFAMFFLYVLAWFGFVVTSLGLAIPPGDGVGVTFRRGQRILFVAAAVGSVASAILPFVLFGLLLQDPALLVYGWLAMAGLTLLSFVAAVGWRLLDAVRSRTT